MPGKTRLRNYLLCVQWDVKPYRLTHSDEVVMGGTVGGRHGIYARVKVLPSYLFKLTNTDSRLFLLLRIICIILVC